jgi:hypothetical protein
MAGGFDRIQPDRKERGGYKHDAAYSNRSLRLDA